MVQAQYAIDSKGHVYLCPHILEADFARDTFICSSLARITRRQEKRELSLLLTYVGTALILVNSGLREGLIHRNGNIRHLPLRKG